jgi:hypothetical protein
MRKKGYFGGVCARKPLLREINKAKRLAFAREHVDKSNKAKRLMKKSSRYLTSRDRTALGGNGSRDQET